MAQITWDNHPTESSIVLGTVNGVLWFKIEEWGGTTFMITSLPSPLGTSQSHSTVDAAKGTAQYVLDSFAALVATE